jgi:putative zinc finger protein
LKAERPESCREWRLRLGAYALGDLPAEERAAVDAHLDGCPRCRAEAESLGAVAKLLPLADPSGFEAPAPRPAADLGERIAAAIGGEERVERRQRQRRRFGFALGGVTAALAAAALAVFALGGGDGGGPPEQHVEFGALPGGVKIYAALEPHAYGTQIHVYVKGVRSGTRCLVFLRGPRGERVPAGTFTYRWGEDSAATLSAALDLSRTRAIGVRAGNRTFVAPVESGGATATNNSNEEDVT